MPILTDSDFRDIKKRIRKDPGARAEFGAWGLSKQAWKSVFQVVEDWFVSGFSTTPASSFKSALTAEVGVITNAQAKQIGFVWMGWRYAKNP